MDKKTVRVGRRMDRRVLLAKFLRTSFLQNISGQQLMEKQNDHKKKVIRLNGYVLEKKLNCNIIKSQENTQ